MPRDIAAYRLRLCLVKPPRDSGFEVEESDFAVPHREYQVSALVDQIAWDGSCKETKAGHVITFIGTKINICLLKASVPAVATNATRAEALASPLASLVWNRLANRLIL